MADRTPDGTAEVAIPANGVIATPGIALQFVEWIRREAADNADTRAFDVAVSQLDKILSAQTFDDIMDADSGGTYESRDLVGLEIEIHAGSVRYAKSAERFNSELGVYVQFSATALMDYPSSAVVAGQDMLISSGAPLIIGKIRTLDANGLLPAKVMITGVQAPNGTVLKLGRIPVRAAR
jgi:hypothetical protein